jgi:hypothetical protein
MFSNSALAQGERADVCPSLFLTGPRSLARARVEVQQRFDGTLRAILPGQLSGPCGRLPHWTTPSTQLHHATPSSADTKAGPPAPAAPLHSLEAHPQPPLESTLETDGMTNSLSYYADTVPEPL